eukprot:403349659
MSARYITHNRDAAYNSPNFEGQASPGSGTESVTGTRLGSPNKFISPQKNVQSLKNMLIKQTQSPIRMQLNQTIDEPNKLYSLQDYLMKEKQNKSILSFSQTVKRFYILDFATQSFYYKSHHKSIDCKIVSSFKDIKSVKEVEHTNMQIMKTHPLALKVICGKQTQVLYFDTKEKLSKWGNMLNLVIEENKHKVLMKSFRQKRSQENSALHSQYNSNEGHPLNSFMKMQNNIQVNNTQQIPDDLSNNYLNILSKYASYNSGVEKLKSKTQTINHRFNRSNGSLDPIEENPSFYDNQKASTLRVYRRFEMQNANQKQDMKRGQVDDNFEKKIIASPNHVGKSIQVNQKKPPLQESFAMRQVTDESLISKVKSQTDILRPPHLLNDEKILNRIKSEERVEMPLKHNDSIDDDCPSDTSETVPNEEKDRLNIKKLETIFLSPSRQTKKVEVTTFQNFYDENILDNSVINDLSIIKNVNGQIGNLVGGQQTQIDNLDISLFESKGGAQNKQRMQSFQVSKLYKSQKPNQSHRQYSYQNSKLYNSRSNNGIRGLLVKSINVNKLPSFKVDDETNYPAGSHFSNYYNRAIDSSKIQEQAKVSTLQQLSCLNCNIDI